MANVTTTNPILIDDVSSDLDLADLNVGDSDSYFFIRGLVLTGATANDVVVLKDAASNVVAEIAAKAGELEQKQSIPFRSQGLKLVAADCTLTTGKLLIYLG